MNYYLKLARIHHYIKNVFIVLPLFFSGSLLDRTSLINCVFGFLGFAFISSAIYVINDIVDAESDRCHPKKMHRPIASGKVSVSSGIIFASVLFALSMLTSYYSCRNNIYVIGYVLAYFVLNLLYTLKLKHYPIVDVAILASGFLLRVLFGAGIIGVQISNWLYLTVVTVSFYLALGKRRNEIVCLGQSGDSRKSLQYYNYQFLDKMMYVFAPLSIVFYSLWCIDPLTTAKIAGDYLMWTIPMVIILFMRYSYILEGTSDGDPTDVILHDIPICTIAAVYALYLILIMYIL